MSTSEDRDLGMHRDITRRDFVNGVGVAVTGSLIAPGWLSALDGRPFGGPQAYYPPARTGMRGSHPGSFEVAHQLRDGITWTNATDTRESYDLVVVGAGLSGLSAAYFFLASAGPGARVLVLDNHDDFGGHAKRNEFTHGGRTLLLNGGTSNLESVNHYSTVSRTLLAAIGLDLDRANAASAGSREFYRSLGLGSATFFAKEVFGEDRLVKGRPGRNTGVDWAGWLARTPLSAAARRDIARLNDDSAKPDPMPGLPDWEKKERLARMSYRDFLLEVEKVHPDVIPFYDDGPKGLFCVGIDAYPALYAWAEGYPGFQGMNLEPFSRVGPLTHIGGGQHGRENEWGGGPTIDLPDGNATLARLLVRAMIPDALPGSTLEDSITSLLAYDRLDREGADARIRLNSTVVSARHLGDPESARQVEITYVRGGRAEKVRGDHCVMACYNRVIPYLVPEMPEAQRTALMYGVKMPIVYTSVLIRRWTAFTNLGISRASAPGMYHTGVNLGRSVQLGDYQPPRSPDGPMVLHMTRIPCAPGRPKKEQHRIGREDLLATTFETFERRIRDQLGRMLADGGFDPARDIEAITVNRWPHGYAYSYDTLNDPIEWALFAPDDRPCVIGRRRFGRISIANSDAAATPHTDAAIDEAYRAAGEQLVVRSRARTRTSRFRQEPS
ncbi:MAG: NAD(P)-binding protein [Gemmatimonadetes bacterium]|nr:NAD(P)-binding protein [Gemmatimonadota bacterium]MYE17880.1 NAD(P)-binding protein [Gemmatimonadota bacterium]MYG21347.1 NAD(P)-binding protein [Gemmatimonadota bacterium]MYJ40711.1 NAD(P)-binding protein [Gemmatimonadota bacterium]